jgi:MerR family transcriptional regulator, thiopeptide resistance regulator
MTSHAQRTFHTAAFAAIAGVTARTLHHYDRLGLLRPRRSRAGYRVYSERDLETLEEIVALKFIGIPLKKIAATRRQVRGAFVDVLHVQRETLEAKRATITRAIAAIATAEQALRSGSAIDARLFRRIIEVMHMETDQSDTITKYSALLKAKVAHMSALSAEQRDALRQQWLELIQDIKAASPDDPAGPQAQALLSRWAGLLEALTGTAPGKLLAHGSDQTAFRATPELRDALWQRRAEWLPHDAERETRVPASGEEALAQARERAQSFADPEVLDFIRRAREARQ